LKTKDEDLQKWAKRRQPLEKKRFATETTESQRRAGERCVPPAMRMVIKIKGLQEKQFVRI
jgi:hypothetical protein